MTTEVLASTTERQRCKSTRKDGAQCRAWAQESGLCVFHSPDSAEARRKGGYNSSLKARADKLLPLRLKPLLDRLEQALAAVQEGSFDPRRATAMASLAGAIVRVYESGVLEDRLSSLEQRIEGNHKQRTAA